MANHVVHLLLLFLTLAVYYFLDMGSDFKLAKELYENGYFGACWIILGINTVAIYSINAVGAFWESRDYGLTWRSCFFFVLPYGLLYQRIRCLALLLPIVFYEGLNITGYNIEQILMREDWKAIILALIQTLSANIFHIVWQLHLVISEGLDVIGWKLSALSSVALSILSCSMALGDYHNGRRNILSVVSKDQKIHVSAYFLTYIATFCVLTSRFAAIILSLSTWMRYICIVLGCTHWMCALIAVFKWDLDLFHEVKIKKNQSGTEDNTYSLRATTGRNCKLVGLVLYSFLFVVSHIEVKHKEKLIFVYLLENCALLIGWYFTYHKEETWHLWFMNGMILANLVGIALNLLVWFKCVKNYQKIEITNGTTDNGTELRTIA